MSWRHSDAARHASTARNHGILVWTLALLAGALTFVGGAYYFALAGAFGEIDTHDFTVNLPPAERPNPPPVDATKGQAVNLLVLGSDSRVGANANIGGVAGGMRNDTTILIHISADRTRVELVSIPRDSMVQISDCTLSDGTVVKGKETLFNAAFSNGGRQGDVGDAAGCVIKNVEDLTGIYISEYVVVDFYGVQTVVDILGGVPMCVPYAVNSPEAGLYVSAGPQKFNGATALAWARARKMHFTNTADRKAFEAVYGANGDDRHRIERQQELIGKVFEVAIDQNLFTDFIDLTSVLEAAAGSMTTSPNIAELDYVVGLAWSIRHIDKANIVFATVPTKWHPNGNNLIWTEDAAPLFQSIIDDVPIAGSSVADFSDAAPVPAPTVSGSPTTGDTEAIDLLGACAAGA